jgi:hypothetical protein
MDVPDIQYTRSGDVAIAYWECLTPWHVQP